jgi:hypothetical protein
MKTRRMAATVVAVMLGATGLLLMAPTAGASQVARPSFCSTVKSESSTSGSTSLSPGSLGKSLKYINKLLKSHPSKSVKGALKTIRKFIQALTKGSQVPESAGVLKAITTFTKAVAACGTANFGSG